MKVYRAGYTALLVILVASLSLFACQPTSGPVETQEQAAVAPTEPAMEAPDTAVPEPEMGEAPTEVEAVEEPSGPVEPVKVAFLATNIVDDHSWNQWIYEGLHQLELEGEINLSVSEKVEIPDYERIATNYAEEGYDLILGNTPEMQDASMLVAEKYPDQAFAVVGAWMYAHNHASLLIHQTEGGYLAGLVAGSMSKTGKIGAVGCFEVPTQIAMHEGFKMGAAEVNPDIVVEENWTGTWYDTNIGYEAGRAMYESGIDVVMISCSGPGFGVIESAKDYGPEALVIGAFVDMHELAPDNVITSIYWASYGAAKEMVQDIRAGKFEGKDYWGTVSNGGIGLSPYWGFETRIPEDVKLMVRDATQQISDGTLVIPWIGEKE
jgi:basic membrane protein A